MSGIYQAPEYQPGREPGDVQAVLFRSQIFSVLWMIPCSLGFGVQLYSLWMMSVSHSRMVLAWSSGGGAFAIACLNMVLKARTPVVIRLPQSWGQVTISSPQLDEWVDSCPEGLIDHDPESHRLAYQALPGWIPSPEICHAGDLHQSKECPHE